MRFLAGLVGLLVLVGVQGALAPHLRVLGVMPDLPLVAVLVVALRAGPVRGVVWGVVAGALLDLLNAAHIGLFALAGGAAGWLCGEAMLRIDPAPAGVRWAVTTAGAALYGGTVLFGLLVLGHSAAYVPGLWRHAAIAAPYDGLLATLAYGIIETGARRWRTIRGRR